MRNTVRQKRVKKARVIPGFRCTFGIVVLMLSLIVLIPLASVLVYSLKISPGEFFSLLWKSNVRNAFTKGGGSVGTTGCVSYMFDEKGQIIIDKEECDMDADDLMMQALDAGADDFSEEEDSYEITTSPEDFETVRKALEDAGIEMASAEVTMIPQTWVTLDNEEDIKNIQKTLDLLEDDDDVQEVYHNWEEA